MNRQTLEMMIALLLVENCHGQLLDEVVSKSAIRYKILLDGEIILIF